jgi:hypothetical protein
MAFYSSFWSLTGASPLIQQLAAAGQGHLCLTTQGKPAVFNGQLAKPAIYSSLKSKIVNF